jgi:hypothetical protein
MSKRQKSSSSEGPLDDALYCQVSQLQLENEKLKEYLKKANDKLVATNEFIKKIKKEKEDRINELTKHLNESEMVIKLSMEIETSRRDRINQTLSFYDQLKEKLSISSLHESYDEIVKMERDNLKACENTLQEFRKILEPSVGGSLNVRA